MQRSAWASLRARGDVVPVSATSTLSVSPASSWPAWSLIVTSFWFWAGATWAGAGRARPGRRRGCCSWHDLQGGLARETTPDLRADLVDDEAQLGRRAAEI